MSILSNRSVKSKLIGGFVVTAIITGIVGAIGYFSIRGLQNNIHEVGAVRLPSVESLLKIKIGAEKIKTAQRTLLNINKDPEVHKRQYDNVANARKDYEAAWKVYEPLPQTPEEAVVWKDFVSAWGEWRKDNTEFFRLSKELDNLQIEDPAVLEARVQEARSGHNGLCRKILEALESKKTFSGGDDHTACNFGKWLHSFKTENPEIRSAIENAMAPHEKFHGSVAKIKELIGKGDLDSAKTLYQSEMVPAVDAVLAQMDQIYAVAEKGAKLRNQMTHQSEVVCRDSQNKSNGLLDQLVKINTDVGVEEVKGANQSAARAVLLATVATVAGFFVALGLGVFLAVAITRPINQTVSMIKDIAQGEGDLTKRLQVSTKDEIGELANWFNTFVDKLQGIIKQIAGNTQVLASSSTELSATATQLAGGAEETTNQSTTVASAAEEMAANMNNMAAATEEMNANVKTVASATEQMTASISEIAKNAEHASTVVANAANMAQASNQTIGQLGTAADEIGKVIEVIQDIAEQTNLLALNATIEAARAGDAGKGFAVVATEVKELAKQTAEATVDIRARIQGIQTSSSQAVDSISQIGEIIQQINEISRTIASAVEEQSVTTKEIAQNIAQTSQAAQTVSAGVSQSAAASKEITRTIAGVDQAARQTAQGASHTKTAGTELSKVSEQLQSLVNQFQV